jgi:uncharacterized membrane protein
MYRQAFQVGSTILNVGLSIKSLFVSNQNHHRSTELSDTHHHESQLLTYSASVNEHQNKADDDEYEQKNNEVQTVMLLSSLFMQGGFQIISSSQTKTILFVASLSISISFLFLSVLFGLSTIHRMAKFMAGRARERNRQLRTIRANLMQQVAPPSIELLRTNPRVILHGMTIETFHDWFLCKCAFMCTLHLFFFKVGCVSLMITMMAIVWSYVFIIPMAVALFFYGLLEWKEKKESSIEWEV